MNELLEKLMDLPHATIIADVIVVIIVVAYLQGSITLDQALIALGVNTTGAGFLGHARNGSGRGIKR